LIRSDRTRCAAGFFGLNQTAEINYFFSEARFHINTSEGFLPATFTRRSN
jgi:hypothetical protein